MRSMVLPLVPQQELIFGLVIVRITPPPPDDDPEKAVLFLFLVRGWLRNKSNGSKRIYHSLTGC